MDLIVAQSLANSLIKEHLSNTGYRFVWNSRRKAAGICNYRLKQIQLSKAITMYSNVTDVTDTILHEIAHALAGYDAGHGYKWQQIAKSIGCNGDKYYNADNKKSSYEAFKIVARYKAVCCNGHESFLNRKPKRKYSCAKCSNRYDERFVLTYLPNY